MNIIEIRNINKYFGEGNSRVHVLKDINLEGRLDPVRGLNLVLSASDGQDGSLGLEGSLVITSNISVELVPGPAVVHEI